MCEVNYNVEKTTLLGFLTCWFCQNKYKHREPF